MNYITRLQAENAAKDRELAALYAEISMLRSYLHSEKFAVDTTVQTSDVILRLATVVWSGSVAAENLGKEESV